MDIDTEYICSDDTWTITTDVCDDGSSDYKLVIDIGTATDGLLIESSFLRLAGGYYPVEAW